MKDMDEREKIDNAVAWLGSCPEEKYLSMAIIIMACHQEGGMQEKDLSDIVDFYQPTISSALNLLKMVRDGLLEYAGMVDDEPSFRLTKKGFDVGAKPNNASLQGQK